MSWRTAGPALLHVAVDRDYDWRRWGEGVAVCKAVNGGQLKGRWMTTTGVSSVVMTQAAIGLCQK